MAARLLPGHRAEAHSYSATKRLRSRHPGGRVQRLVLPCRCGGLSGAVSYAAHETQRRGLTPDEGGPPPLPSGPLASQHRNRLRRGDREPVGAGMQADPCEPAGEFDRVRAGGPAACSRRARSAACTLSACLEVATPERYQPTRSQRNHQAGECSMRARGDKALSKGVVLGQSSDLEILEIR